MPAFQESLRLAHRAFEEATGPACHTLAQLGFDQPYQALRRLDLLVDLAGPAYALDPPVSLLAAVSQSVQPDQALRRLERFFQRAGGITVLEQRTNDAPILGQQLAQILSLQRLFDRCPDARPGVPLLAAGRDDLPEPAAGPVCPPPRPNPRDG